MEDAIQDLEEKMQALILQCEHLKRANTKLNQSKSKLERENEILLAKHKIAITQIEAMVSKLKTIENS